MLNDMQPMVNNPALLRLPYELLLDILELAALPTLAQTPENDVRPLQRWLRSMATVCRAFVEPSQAILCRYLSFSTSKQASKWLASSLTGRYATRQVSLTGVHSGSGLSGSQAMRVLQHCQGIRWLRLADFKRLSCRIFSLPSLRGKQAEAS